MIIEYEVTFKDQDKPILFCGEFESIEHFEKRVTAPGSCFFKGYLSHKILSVTNRIYKGHGVTKNSYKLTSEIDKILGDKVKELFEIQELLSIDPRDFMHYCQDTFELMLTTENVKKAVKKRKSYTL